ncbi:AraC-like DNA-binding protein [Paraburkholderia sacchari]|uniref:AraC family transcriptional regulator n=1 Tax=Paraburkholderia sacchari TaxID=159450 RepID=UPI0039A42C7E
MPSLARSAALTGYETLCASAGIDPWQLLSETGLPASCLHLPELRIPTEKLARLLERSARLSGIESFGLQLAQGRPLSTIGPLALLVRDQPTLRHAIDLFNQYRHLRASAIELYVEKYGDLTIIKQELLIGQAIPARQTVELALGLTVQCIKRLLGPDWRPIGISFSHRAPASTAAHIRLLECPVQFDSVCTGILCQPGDLDRPLPFADPAMARHAQEYLNSLHTGTRAGMADHVRTALAAVLQTGNINADRVAEKLGISRRMLQRRLEDEHTTFSALLTEVRKERVVYLLASGKHGLSGVAELIGFTHQSTFSRWFRTEFGCSPSDFQRLSPE